MAVDAPDYEIAMKFTDEQGKDIFKGESSMQVNPEDGFMKSEFKAIVSLDDYSNFFEVQSFDFKLKVEPTQATSNKLGQIKTTAGPRGGSSGLLHAAPPASGTAGSSAQAASAGGSSDPFERWRSVPKSQAKDMKFYAELEEFTFTRTIDGYSPLLFGYCVNKTKLFSATLVKRVSRGGIGDIKSSIAMSFLQIRFEGITVRGLKWNDGELVTETCDFKCNKVWLSYKPQLYSGGLGAASKPFFWNRQIASDRKSGAL